MKGIMSLLALAVALAGPAFAGDVNDRSRPGRLQEGCRAVGCCDEHVRREEDVGSHDVSNT